MHGVVVLLNAKNHGFSPRVREGEWLVYTCPWRSPTTFAL